METETNIVNGKNKKLALDALEYCRTHPEEYDQTAWATKTACGTACCYAGNVVRLGDPDASFLFLNGCENDTAIFVYTGDGEHKEISIYAIELLWPGVGPCPTPSGDDLHSEWNYIPSEEDDWHWKVEDLRQAFDGELSLDQVQDRIREWLKEDETE